MENQTHTGAASSSIREKVDTERWFFIADWCKKKRISPMHADNFNRAAMEWSKLNCFEPDALVLPSADTKTQPKETTL